MSNQIPDLVSTAMENIKQMIDVNTIVGEPVEISAETVIIPISRVSFGFGAGGSEFPQEKNSNKDAPFGGGSGAGVSIHPVGFLVMSNNNVRFLPIVSSHSAVDKLVDYIPSAFEKLSEFFENRKKKA